MPHRTQQPVVMEALEGGLHGAHLRADVLAQIGPTALRRAIRDRTLSRSWSQVVVESHRQCEPLTRSAAAVLAFGSRCALAGPTAAELHGCGAAATPSTYVLMPYGSHPRPRLGLVIQHSTGYERDVDTIGRLPVLALDRVVADMLCRIAPLSGGELRLGIALSLLGAPFFLALLLRMRRGLA